MLFRFKFSQSIICMTFLVVGMLSLSACASKGGVSYSDASLGIHDPLEEKNRIVLKFNDAADKIILEPVARGYRKYTPGAARTVVHNFLQNLTSPIIIGNQLLQGDLKGAGNATARVIINTLAGFGGVLDLATEGGIEYQPEDFGQTLAKWGVGDGMYVMIPLLGPSNLRDATGQLVDNYVDPLRLYFYNIDKNGRNYTRTGASILSKREELLDVVDDLRRNSFDYYAAIRSSYYQHRQALINDQDPSMVSGPDIPDYNDF